MILLPSRRRAPLDGLSVRPNLWLDIARRDFSSHNGPLLTVARADTAATKDIYYDSAGMLDTADIASFCSGTTGRGRRPADQSGNGRDLEQTTLTTMPNVFSGGSMVTLGSLPAMDFDPASNKYLSRADACGLTGAPGLTIVIVADSDAYSSTDKWPYGVGRSTAASPGYAFYGGYDSATSMSNRYHGANQIFGSGISSGAGQAPHYIIRTLAAGGQIGNGTLEVNGSAATETSEAAPTTTLSLLDDMTLLGGRLISEMGVVASFDGRITAFGLWGSVLSAGDLAIVRACCASLIV